jgi:hypothetical protein
MSRVHASQVWRAVRLHLTGGDISKPFADDCTMIEPCGRDTCRCTQPLQLGKPEARVREFFRALKATDAYGSDRAFREFVDALEMEEFFPQPNT